MENKIIFILDHEPFEKVFPSDVGSDRVFTEAAHMICFSDCTDIQVVDLIVNGKHCVYAGWKPGMVYIFNDADTSEEVWRCSFPEWDH